jgi:hypothetical protein
MFEDLLDENEVVRTTDAPEVIRIERHAQALGLDSYL